MDSLKERFDSHELPLEMKQLFISDDAVAICLTENCRELTKLQSKNRRHIRVNRVAQKILTTESDLLKIDGVYLKDLDELYSCTVEMLSSLFSILNEDNYLEIGRLVDFILMIYSNNYSSIGSKRRSLKFNKKGIEFIDNRFMDTKLDEFNEFFLNETSKYKKEKILEKKKKI